MQPDENSTNIRLPITFDYNGGRGDKKRGNILVAIVLTVIIIILTIGVIRNVDMATGSKIIFLAVAWVIYTSVLRFKVFKEMTYSDAYETLKEIDFVPNTDSFWNIYEVDSTYPYVCHFKDGKHGVFVRMEKDVVVGKGDLSAFNHYEAISEAYNLAGSLNMNMAQIDYMDNVGNDPRLKKLYDNLNDCDNPDLREVMLSMYSNLQDEMSRDYASFDVYVFTSRGNPSQLEYNVKACVDRLLAGNYLSYRALDIEGLRTTCMAVFNLNEFSAIEACNNVFNDSKYRGIIPIKVTHAGGEVTELHKTQAQLKKEAQERAKRLAEEKEAKKLKNRLKALKNGKPKKNTGVSEESKKEQSVKQEENKADRLGSEVKEKSSDKGLKIIGTKSDKETPEIEKEEVSKDTTESKDIANQESSAVKEVSEVVNQGNTSVKEVSEDTTESEDIASQESSAVKEIGSEDTNQESTAVKEYSKNAEEGVSDQDETVGKEVQAGVLNSAVQEDEDLNLF